jgi:hypothetical protein
LSIPGRWMPKMDSPENIGWPCNPSRWQGQRRIDIRRIVRPAGTFVLCANRWKNKPSAYPTCRRRPGRRQRRSPPFFRVKALVAQRPPHRPVLEDFPHTVPRFQPFLPNWKPNRRHPVWRITLLPIRFIRYYYGLSWVLEVHSLLGFSRTSPS